MSADGVGENAKVAISLTETAKACETLAQWLVGKPELERIYAHRLRGSLAETRGRIDEAWRNVTGPS